MAGVTAEPISAGGPIVSLLRQKTIRSDALMSTMREPIGAGELRDRNVRCRLGDMGSGARAAVVALPPEEAPELAALGILPGTEMEIVQNTPFCGPLLVRVGGGIYALGRMLADRVWVIPR